MEPTTATADTAMVSLWVREIEHPEADDQVVALLADLRPGTADLVGAILAAATQGVRYLGAYERAGRLAAVAGWRVMASTRGRASPRAVGHSGVTRSDAHRFYARVGLSIGAFHFTKPLGAATDARETRGARA
jgi:hypothetical protein